MRKGILVAAVAAFLATAAPAAHADPLLTIAPPPTTGGQLFAVPYTLSPAAQADLLVLALRAPGAANFENYATLPASLSGTITTVIYQYPIGDVVEGDWQVRLTAYRYTDMPVAVAEGTTRLEYEGGFWVSAPYFGEVPVGVTSLPQRLRIKNIIGGPLRIRSVTAPAGSELAITDDGCANRTLFIVDFCEVGVTFTPAAAGQRRGTVLVDSSSPNKEVYMIGVGIAVPVDPTPQPAPSPTPTPTPTSQVQDPELTFASVPGRASTWLQGLRLEHVPAGSTVTVRCAKGCPAKSFTKRGAKGTVSLKRFATRALKAGTTIRITLAVPGQPLRSATIKIRARRAPQVSGSL